MDNDAVAEVLNEIAILLDLKGENPFKARAYTSAARTVETLGEPVATIAAEGRLGKVKGIGEALAAKISELTASGAMAYHQELKASVPPGLLEMLKLPGLGPKKVKALHDKLGLASVEALKAACEAGQVAALEGFGEKSQAKILEGIQFRATFADRHHLSTAHDLADPVLDGLRRHPDVTRCAQAGSLRRAKEVVGDIDFLASSKNPEAVIRHFTSQPLVLSVLAAGETKASVVLEGGVQADLRVVSDLEYPFALAYFTGSKEHNIAMRQRAIQRGLRLNEYGLFRSAEETRDPALRLPCRTEDEIFEALGLAPIPPELREDMGEFEAAEAGKIPRLLEWTQLRGSLHNHTNWSDGRETIEETARAMIELGFSYWAITDHSKSSFQANGLRPERLEAQIREVAEVNRKLAEEGADFQLLTGSEVDILSAGALDYDDELLSRLDVVVASIHQGFSADEAEMTRRLVRAAENPHVHMLGHLTGRLLLERNAYKIDHRAVIEACAAAGTWIELNANPWRLDMDWRHWRVAKELGVKCVVNCDAHRVEHARFLRFGAMVARKGWLEARDVVNTLPLRELRRELGRKRAALG